MTEAPEQTFPQLNLSLATSLLAVRRVLEYGGKPALARLPLISLHPTIGIEKRGAESLAPEWSTFVPAALGEVRWGEGGCKRLGGMQEASVSLHRVTQRLS